VTTNLKPGGSTAPVSVTTAPPSFTTFTHLLHSPEQKKTDRMKMQHVLDKMNYHWVLWQLHLSIMGWNDLCRQLTKDILLVVTIGHLHLTFDSSICNKNCDMGRIF
jgi:hypothetical protein